MSKLAMKVIKDFTSALDALMIHLKYLAIQLVNTKRFKM